MADSRNLVLQLLITAKDGASEVVDRVRTGLGGIGAAANSALEPLRSFGGLLAAALGLGGAKQVIDLADAYTRLTNSVRIATTTEEEYQSALTAVIQIAKNSNADLDTTAQLYGKVASNAKNLGLAQNEVADVTALVSKAMQLSGADTSAANGAILQFTQALSSGVLRGEEFNSVMEASPAMMKAIAAGMGVAVGELRAMAEAGQLTADVVVKSLLSQKDAINEVYGKLPQTVAQGMQQLGNAATIFAGKLNEQTGATQTLGAGLKFLSQNLDSVTALIGAGLTVATARGVVAMTGYVQASIAASAAAKEQAIAQSAATAASIRDAEANVAAAQAAYNAALATQRQTQAILTLMQANLGYGTTEADVTAARIAAASAANTATAATQRYAIAQAALNGLQAESAAATGLFARAMGFLAGPGGLILLAVSAFGLLYSAFSRQKSVADDLTKSTDQYAESLKKMNTAQLTAELGKFSGTIEEQKRQVAAAHAEVEKYKTGHIGLYEALTESQSRAQLLTEAEGKQADAEAKLALLQANRTEAINRLAAANQQAEGSISGLTTAYRQQSVAMDKVAALYEKQADYLKTIADAQQAETKALLDQATAANNRNEIDRLTIQLAAQKASAAKDQAELSRGEAVAAQLKVDALEKVRDIQGALTSVEAGALQAARQSAAAKNAEALASEALAATLQKEKASTESGVEAKKRWTAETEKVTGSTQSYSDALDRISKAQIAGIQSEIDYARAKGDTYTVSQKTKDLAILEAQWAQTLASAKQAEITAEVASTQAKIAELQASENVTAAIQAQINALQLKVVALGQENEAQALASKLQAEVQRQRELGVAQQDNTTSATERNSIATVENTDAQEKNVKVVDNLAKIHTGLIQALTDARKRMSDLSETAGAYFEAMLQGELNAKGLTGAFQSSGLAAEALNRALEGGDGTTEALARFETNAAQAGAALGKARQDMLQTVNMLDTYTTAMEIAEAATRKTYYEQAAAAERMRISIEEMTDSGKISAQQLSLAANAAKGEFSLLDQEDLSGLTSSIEKANQKLREMQQETQSAQDRLAELNAEIAAAKGDTATADRLKLELEQQQNLAAVDAELATARAANNRDLIALYEEQKQKLQELYALKEKNLDADIQARQEQERTSKSQSSSGDGSGSGGSSRTSTSAGSGTSSTGGGLSGRSAGGGVNLTINTTGGFIDANFAEALARKLKPKLDEIARRST